MTDRPGGSGPAAADAGGASLFRAGGRGSPARALALGALAVGVLDIADAFVFYGLEGAAPGLILRSIASGLLGKAAFSGGAAVAALGLVLHFFIALVVVLVCYAASALFPVLSARPFLAGAGYGLVVYAVMYGVVLPLSAHGSARFTVASVADELLAHIFLVGMPAALAVRAARRGRSTGVPPAV